VQIDFICVELVSNWQTWLVLIRLLCWEDPPSYNCFGCFSSDFCLEHGTNVLWLFYSNCWRWGCLHGWLGRRQGWKVGHSWQM